MKTGIENYKATEKNKWRYRIWREVKKRVKSPKDSTILYLAAKQDLDRRQAMACGFRANNMIAVDIDRDVVEMHRKNNKLAVAGDIKDVAFFWKGSNVVHMDFCNGLTDSNAAKINNLLVSGLLVEGSVVVANFLRGRESGVANKHMKLLNKFFADHNKFFPAIFVKHRGAILLWMIAMDMAESFSDSLNIEHEHLFELTITIFNSYRPKFYCYKSDSGNQYFDSVVISVSQSVLGCQLVSPDVNKDVDYKIYLEETRGLRSQIAAVKAVQTMRKNGHLAPCSNF